MTNDTTRREMVDEGRAAFLLGLPQEQLREICELSGLGHLEDRAELQEEASDLRLVFTYEELHKLCRLIVGPTS
jgi:hypothetical protein